MLIGSEQQQLNKGMSGEDCLRRPGPISCFSAKDDNFFYSKEMKGPINSEDEFIIASFNYINIFK